jgi:hypothetical protein
MDNIINSYTDRGYIYILDHSSYKGNIKISRTNNLKKRLGSHSCAHVIKPQMIFTIKAMNYKLAEKLVHQRLRRHRVKCQSSREFFNVDINDAIDTIKEVIDIVNNPIVISTNE